MGDVDDEILALRNIAHRMSQGIEIKSRSYGMLQFRNVFLGKDAVEWLIADPRSGVVDLDGAIQMGQRMIEEGYVLRISREFKAQELRHFGRQQKAKRHFRSGDAIYRFDNLRISPFLLHVVVQQARNLVPHDLNGKNDPYVKMRLGQQSAMTRVQLKTNNPVWNEHFLFGVSSVEAQQLHLTVYDYDRYKHDDLIGTCHIGLSHLPVEEAGDPVFGTESLAASIVDYTHPSSAAGEDAGVHMGYVGGGNHPVLEEGDIEGEERRRHSIFETRSLTSAPTGSLGSEFVGLGRPATMVSGDGSHHSDLGLADWDDSDARHDSLSSLGGARQKGRKRETPGASASVHSGIAPKRRSGLVRSITPWGRKRDNLASNFTDIGHDLTRRPNGLPLHGSAEAVKFYPLNPGNDSLFCSKDKRGAKVESKSESSPEQEAKKRPQELGCDIWLTSFRPRPLPVQGEAKFTLRCRLWDLSGVTSSEERNLGNMHSNVIKHRTVLMLSGDRVLSSSCERNKATLPGKWSQELLDSLSKFPVLVYNFSHNGCRPHSCTSTFHSFQSNLYKEDKRTTFNGTLVSLDTKANMATDMLKFVVQQKNASVELVYKPVATVSVPLRSIPVVFPGENTSSGAAPVAEPINHSDASAHRSMSMMGEGVSSKSGRGTESTRRKGRSIFGGGSVSSRSYRRSSESSEGEGEKPIKVPFPGEPRPRKYRLQTLAGPFTSRTMDNGFVMMSLMLVPSGNDLLGEQEPADSEPLEGPLPEVPETLSAPCLDVPIKCGYQRLRKALLWHDSKLMAALAERLDHKDVAASPWLDKEGETGQQEDMTGCTRQRSFILPKTAMAASNKAEAEDVMLIDGPCAMSYQSRVRTPEVPFGDKFEVMIRFVLVKEGPEKCRLSTSAQAEFTGQIMSLIQSQISSAVPKVTKEEHKTLLELVEEALSGGGGGGGGGRDARRGATKGSGRAYLWFLGIFMLLAIVALSWLALALEVLETPPVLHDAMMRAGIPTRLHQLAFSESKTEEDEAEGEAGACVAEVVETLEVAPCDNDVDGGAVGHGAARMAGGEGDHGASSGESDLEAEVTAIGGTNLHPGASADGSDKGDVVDTAVTNVTSGLASGASDDVPRADGENHDEG